MTKRLTDDNTIKIIVSWTFISELLFSKECNCMCFDIVTNLPRFTQDCSTNLVARFWHFISAVASAIIETQNLTSVKLCAECDS